MNYNTDQRARKAFGKAITQAAASFKRVTMSVGEGPKTCEGIFPVIPVNGVYRFQVTLEVPADWRACHCERCRPSQTFLLKTALKGWIEREFTQHDIFGIFPERINATITAEQTEVQP